MTLRTLFTLLLAVAAFACQKKQQESEAPVAKDSVATAVAPVTLKLKWESEAQLTTCESVLYDKENDVLYVSNINGAPDGKDGNGFISKVAMDGKITAVQWAKGMDAPKGMGISNGKLFVADIDRIHEVDLKTGKVTKSHKVGGAKFLNDITTDGSGKVYISDSNDVVIYVIENGKVSKWMENIDHPNGLFAEDSQILVALWNGKSLNTIDPATKQVTLRTEGIENPDGIEAIGDGAYLVSSWNGMIHHVDSDWKKTLVLDTRADSLSSADIEYIQEKNLLLIPTFFKNKVMAYELSK